MGACESSNADGKRKARGRGEGLNKNGSRRAATKMPKLKKADLDSSSQMDEVEAEDEKIQVLRRGQRKELKNMIEKYKDDNDINDYMDQNRTLLLEAVINCPNPEVIDMIMDKGADIDKEEYQTGNTAIFLAAVDLKVDFVRELLKYSPNLNHKNHNKQDISEFLDFQLVEQREKIGRKMTAKEAEKYEQIKEMLNIN